jgi:restriction system protein
MKRKYSQVPTFDQLMNPTLEALRELGGSGTKQEIYEKVIEVLKLPDEILEIPHKKEGGSQTKVDYRLAWALTYLGKAGIIENSARGVWALSSSNSFDKVEPKDIVKHYRNMCRPKKKVLEGIMSEGEMDLSPDDIEISDVQQDWRINLRKVLTSMKPDAFERLAQRILRESGFIQVEVLGKSGDGGIDGKGIAQINGLLSFM